MHMLHTQRVSSEFLPFQGTFTQSHTYINSLFTKIVTFMVGFSVDGDNKCLHAVMFTTLGVRLMI
jgi:hypothetical protein